MRNYQLDKEKWQSRLKKKDIEKKHFTLEELYNRTQNRMPQTMTKQQSQEIGLIKKSIDKRSK